MQKRYQVSIFVYFVSEMRCFSIHQQAPKMWIIFSYDFPWAIIYSGSSSMTHVDIENISNCFFNNFFSLVSVRATSVLCLLGLGLGLGSILIYRLCSRLFASGNATQTPSLTARGRRRSSQSSLDENSDSRRLSPQVCLQHSDKWMIFQYKDAVLPA